MSRATVCPVSILFGHPTGNPNSHQAALAHFEAGRLEAFCVPWRPSPLEIRILRMVPNMTDWAARLSRRSFSPLANVPIVQGRLSEWIRMMKRVFHPDATSADELILQANLWLMKTMTREAQRRPRVTALHAYEDCSLLQFRQAKRRGQACIYDMPIGYYRAWQEVESRLLKTFSEWLPPSGRERGRPINAAQKSEEMSLADLVLVPGSFVRRSIETYTNKRIETATYGVNTEFWMPHPRKNEDKPLRYIYAGHCSIRKGTPLLLQAWANAGLVNAELYLIGPWQLSKSKLKELPPGVVYFQQVSPETLREHFQAADVFVFPSFFEGFALIVLEAMASGLPVISSDATVAVDLVDECVGRVFPAGSLDILIDHLRFFHFNRDALPAMGRSARSKVEKLTWKSYREAVSAACESFG